MNRNSSSLKLGGKKAPLAGKSLFLLRKGGSDGGEEGSSGKRGFTVTPRCRQNAVSGEGGLLLDRKLLSTKTSLISKEVLQCVLLSKNWKEKRAPGGKNRGGVAN